MICLLGIVGCSDILAHVVHRSVCYSTCQPLSIRELVETALVSLLSGCFCAERIILVKSMNLISSTSHLKTHFWCWSPEHWVKLRFSLLGQVQHLILKLRVKDIAIEVDIDKREERLDWRRIIKACICTKSITLSLSKSKGSQIQILAWKSCSCVLKHWCMHNGWKLSSHIDHVLLKSNLSQSWHDSELNVSSVYLSLECLVKQGIHPPVKHVRLLAIAFQRVLGSAEAKCVTDRYPICEVGSNGVSISCILFYHQVHWCFSKCDQLF